jgi:hypothetical protein
MIMSRQVTRKGRQRSILSVVLASIPVLALTAGVPFANRLEPRILGFPFLIAYLTVWVILTPVFLYAVNLLWTQE